VATKPSQMSAPMSMRTSFAATTLQFGRNFYVHDDQRHQTWQNKGHMNKSSRANPCGACSTESNQHLHWEPPARAITWLGRTSHPFMVDHELQQCKRCLFEVTSHAHQALNWSKSVGSFYAMAPKMHCSGHKHGEQASPVTSPVAFIDH